MANNLKFTALFPTAAAAPLFHTNIWLPMDRWSDGYSSAKMSMCECINGRVCSKIVL